MLSPFHIHSIYLLPPTLSSFLDTPTLLELACTTKNIYHQLKYHLQEQNARLFLTLIDYFYYRSYNVKGDKTISLTRRKDDVYEKNVRLLFHFLPELFQFMNVHHITSLDLGCTSSYGSYPESAYELVSNNENTIKQISKQLLSLLSTNTSLEWCNLGLFDNIIDYSDIERAVKKHPTIDRISMIPSRATTYYNQLPKTLWRNRRNGTFYWNHWREAPEDE